MSDETNLIFSYTVEQDHALNNAGHVFLGVAHDNNDEEVHVFLRKGHDLADRA